MESHLDEMAWRVLAVLQADGRLSYSEIGRRVGLSPPAAAERVRRLEEAGAITGYGAGVDPARLGYAVTAFISLGTENARYQRVRRLAVELPEVVECHHVSGDPSFLIKVRAGSLEHLERVISRFAEVGRTSTAIALSTSLDGKPIAGPPRAASGR